MEIRVFEQDGAVASAAAQLASQTIRDAIKKRGKARVIAATGTSQYKFLDELVAMPEIEWPKVELFHLDEYIGLAPDHPASFNHYIQERIVRRVPVGSYHLLDGTGDPKKVIQEIGTELQREPADICFTGLGENGHLAFNDPPADFATKEPYIMVTLAEASRRQQLSEGLFQSLADVPKKAITMTIRQITKSRAILCIATGARKNAAVKACFAGEVSPLAPASILETHPTATILLDLAAAGNMKFSEK